jgi:hypothetical protein
MIHSTQRYDDPQHPSVYDGIVRWASHARKRVLAGITAAGIVAAAALLIDDWRSLPIAGAFLTLSAVGGWGLLEQLTATPHSALTTAGQVLLVVLGTIAAIIGGFGLLFWVMGPAPVL